MCIVSAFNVYLLVKVVSFRNNSFSMYASLLYRELRKRRARPPLGLNSLGSIMSGSRLISYLRRTLRSFEFLKIPFNGHKLAFNTFYETPNCHCSIRMILKVSRNKTFSVK